MSRLPGEDLVTLDLVVDMVFIREEYVHFKILSLITVCTAPFSSAMLNEHLNQY